MVILVPFLQTLQSFSSVNLYNFSTTLSPFLASFTYFHKLRKTLFGAPWPLKNIFFYLSTQSQNTSKLIKSSLRRQKNFASLAAHAAQLQLQIRSFQVRLRLFFQNCFIKGALPKKLFLCPSSTQNRSLKLIGSKTLFSLKNKHRRLSAGVRWVAFIRKRGKVCLLLLFFSKRVVII